MFWIAPNGTGKTNTLGPFCRAYHSGTMGTIFFGGEVKRTMSIILSGERNLYMKNPSREPPLSLCFKRYEYTGAIGM